jgi:hypothetical protein
LYGQHNLPEFSWNDLNPAKNFQLLLNNICATAMGSSVSVLGETQGQRWNIIGHGSRQIARSKALLLQSLKTRLINRELSNITKSWNLAISKYDPSPAFMDFQSQHSSVVLKEYSPRDWFVDTFHALFCDKFPVSFKLSILA